MNLNIFVQLSALLKAVQSGEYRAAVCSLGQIATAITCDKPAALLAAAKRDDDTPVAWAELHRECQEKAAAIKGQCEHNEHLVKTGTASDTALPPGVWVALGEFVLQILQFFIKKNTMGGADGPLPKPAEAPPAPPPVEGGAPKSVPLPPPA